MYSLVLGVYLSQVYIIEVVWSEGTSTIIYRRYSNFFEFQVQHDCDVHVHLYMWIQLYMYIA